MKNYQDVGIGGAKCLKGQVHPKHGVGEVRSREGHVPDRGRRVVSIGISDKFIM